jgi:hypothetical protein
VNRAGVTSATSNAGCVSRCREHRCERVLHVGLAAAVLIDATIVRAVLLPATMKLLADGNWYLPRWLEWLPRIGHETPPALEEPSQPAPPRAHPIRV